jgi:hypothetical protein
MECLIHVHIFTLVKIWTFEILNFSNLHQINRTRKLTTSRGFVFALHPFRKLSELTTDAVIRRSCVTIKKLSWRANETYELCFFNIVRPKYLIIKVH